MVASRFWFGFSALVAGLGSAWLVVRWGGDETVAAGAWRSQVLAGSVDAGPYTRARVALGGLLALGPAETLYFVAERDDTGHVLRAGCQYRVRGPVPVARWWSVTAYGQDRFLLPAPAQRYSVNSAAAGASANEIDFVTGPSAPAAGAWLPTPGDRGLLLVLRLYQPGPALRANAAALAPLKILPLGTCP